VRGNQGRKNLFRQERKSDNDRGKSELDSTQIRKMDEVGVGW